MRCGGGHGVNMRVQKSLRHHSEGKICDPCVGPHGEERANVLGTLI